MIPVRGAQRIRNSQATLNMFLATIDVSGVTTNISDVQTALVAAAPTVIGYGLGLAALIYGGKLLWGVFKRFAK